MKDDKILMSEAAFLYYEKKFTQQEIAKMLDLSRQTVSKLLSDAICEKIVEIKIHSPKKEKIELEKTICEKFNIKNAFVSAVSGKNSELRSIATAKTAVDVILPFIKTGNKKIALSWGRSIQILINEMPEIPTEGNLVFPLFGATERKQSYFLSNELTRLFADKIGAKINFAWFPFLPDCEKDFELFKRTTYYRNMEENWDNIDIAIVGIGNRFAIELLEKSFVSKKSKDKQVGDIATHTFSIDGTFDSFNELSLCASIASLKKAKKIIAIASGDDKTEAIVGALNTGLIDTIVTDEYTAVNILQYEYTY